MDGLAEERSSDLLRERIAGLLVGTAVGDALGLPREGISARRAAKMFAGPIDHALVFGRGMISDDTEHACMTAQAILRSGGDVEAFRRSLAWRLRGWLLALPAGVGLATLRSIVKLWLGVPPARSGVWSAGNGPAMRAAIIGACFADEPQRMRQFIEAATLITHRDPRALRGAMLIAMAAATAVRSADGEIDVQRFLGDAMNAAGDDVELLRLLAALTEHLAQDATATEFATAIRQSDGISGYIYHTVVICLFCWLRWPHDFARAVSDVIALGGDTDTTGAIVGALAGASCGASAIPQRWLDGITEYPRSPAWMRKLASRLCEDDAQPLPLNVIAIIPRNLFFLVVVLLHGLRRLLPPY